MRRPSGQDAGPTSPVERRGPRGRRSRWRSRRPSRPGPQRGARAAAGLRPLPGPFLPEHCPSFTTLAARRGHQIPCLFWTLHPVWTLFYYFCLIKASPRPDATPTVSVVCSSRHNIYMCVCMYVCMCVYIYIYILWGGTVHRCHGSVRTLVRGSRFDTISVQHEKKKIYYARFLFIYFEQTVVQIKKNPSRCKNTTYYYMLYIYNPFCFHK